MDQFSLLTIVMPIALGIIMLGLGLSLTIDDFLRVKRYPRAAIVGLSCQLLLLPIICFFVIGIFDLPAELAVGLMLLAAAPGGPVANLYSHLSHGDVALNVTLTAINAFLSLLTLPIIVNFSLQHFMGESQYIPVQLMEMFRIFAIVIFPVLIGMYIRKRHHSLAERMGKPVKIGSAIFLALIIIGLIKQEVHNMKSYFQLVGFAALSFNVLSMGIGYFVPRMFKINIRQSIAVSMEIGIHNGALAIFIALNVLESQTMGIPAAIYSLIMFFTAAAFGFIVNIGRNPEKE